LRLPSLTGLRFVAAALVFAFHTALSGVFTGDVGRHLEFSLSRAATFGVSSFFVLSGFVLTWSARPGDTTTRFWRRRLVKIYPNHVVTFVAAAVLMTLAGFAVAAKPALANLFLIQTWFPVQMDITLSMNILSWSIACEAFFYLLFPVLLRVVQAVPVRRLWLAAGGVAVLIVAVPVAVRFLVDGPATYGEASVAQSWFVYFFPPVRALEFLLGMVLARIVIAGRWLPLTVGQACVVAVLGYLGALWFPFYLVTVSGASAIVIVPLIASAAVADWHGKRSWLRAGGLVWLGDVSYAFYMVHGLILTYAYLVLGAGPWSNWQALGVTVLLFGCSLLAAWLLYATVERPLVRRWSSPRRRPASAVASASAGVGASGGQEPPAALPADAPRVPDVEPDAPLTPSLS
jgi:peptidoglycan/LPS O-acetylase OafA/YrhL